MKETKTVIQISYLSSDEFLAGRSKVKGRCLLDSVTYGAHYGGHAVPDTYDLPFGR